MFLRETSQSDAHWFRVLRRHFKRQWPRFWLGCAIAGSGVWIVGHLAPSLRQLWSTLWPSGNSGVNTAYQASLIMVGVGVTAIVLRPASLWCWKYARGWLAGITSCMLLLGACVTFGVVWCWSGHPRLTVSLAVMSTAALLVLEVWRRQKEPSSTPLGFERLAEIEGPPLPVEARWRANPDAITKWTEDLIGRGEVVTLLADQVLHLRVPIVALRGGFGDGKTSVLNLLRNVIERRAIVVSFRAWLPGSEATFVADLFKDIATECRGYVIVPRLRKYALAFAEMVSHSVSYLAGLRDLIPAQSQKDEIQGLSDALARVPKPIVVLLDEIDRMLKDELLVLLKVLRGAPSFPNVSFVCAFSEEHVRTTAGLQPEGLEKFFPVSVNLSPPASEMIGRCLMTQLLERLKAQGWLTTTQEADEFTELLRESWSDSLGSICTNLRRAGLLVNDIGATQRSIISEVNPFDFVMISAIRRFYPSVYQRIRGGAEFLTTTAEDRFFPGEKHSQPFFVALNGDIEGGPEPTAVRKLLSKLFPEFARANGDRMAGFRRSADHSGAEDDKRVCDPTHFRIYFQGIVPEDMFGHAQMNHMLSQLNEARAEVEARAVFDKSLDSTPRESLKRVDFLRKLAIRVGELSDTAAEHLAYAVAARASDFDYGVWFRSITDTAVQVVSAVAQRLSATPSVQRVLEGCIARATNDAFADALLHSLEDGGGHRALVESSNAEKAAIKRVFIQRMRERYGPESEVSVTPTSHLAFSRWAENSGDDQRLEQEYWRRFIGRSRKRLAQAINVLYPGGFAWRENPTPLLDRLFPTAEIGALLKDLPNDEPLDDAERGGIERMRRLLETGDFGRAVGPGPRS